MNSGGKYGPLYRHLLRQGKGKCTLTFAEIEQLIGDSLPISASKRGWWSNRGNALQASSWLEAGYKVSNIDIKTESITFSKIKANTNYKIYQDERGIVLWNSELIRGLREFMGLTQEQFAEEMGVRQQTISEWEQGKYTPKKATAKHLMLVAEKAGFYKTK